MNSVHGKYIRVSRGNKHYYLGMYLDLSIREEVRLTMVDYLKKLIEDLP